MKENTSDFSFFQYASANEPQKAIMDAINACRKKASQLYDVTTKEKPAVIFSNDGTGFGKSYGVINSFIESMQEAILLDGGFNNLIFITPQKAQIDFSPDLVDKANKRGIEFLSFLSRADMIDLDFESWVPGTDGCKQINRDRYKQWIRRGRNNNTINRELKRLDEVIKTIESINRRIETNSLDDELDYIDELQDQLSNHQDLLEKTLEKTALAAFNLDGEPVSLREIITSTSDINVLRKEIICHCIPFAMAMVKPCIMLATTHKFDRTIDLPAKKKSGEFYFKQLPFDCILGGKKKLSENNTSRYVDFTHHEQLEFLKAEFFAVDSNNYFRTHNISFTLVIDEEHEAHKIFSASASVPLITPDIQLAHVFAGVNRVLMQIENIDKDEIDEAPFYQEKRDFVASIKAQLDKRCELPAHLDLSTVLKVFASNIDFVLIKSNDVEQVINITRNIFNFTPKRYFNEQGLKRIKVRPSYGLGACQLYYTTSEDDPNPSLHDVYQITMAVLYAAAKISSSSEFLKSLRQGRDSSQNFPLYKFICRAKKVVSEVEHMFERVDNEDLEINHFFTYFLPKTVFSVERLRELEFQDDSLSRLTYVNFTMDLLKEQPEVSMLRMLYDTQNTIICLSATSGFAGNITGQYNRNFLRKYCSDTEDNLAIQVLTRTEDDAKVLSELRNNRAVLREATYWPFDANDTILSNAQRDPEFQEQYRIWRKNLGGFGKYISIYQRREFDRQLAAMLLAAYEPKHTLSLSLSGRFINVVKEYLQAVHCGQKAKLRTLNILEKGNRVFEITPC